MERRTGSNNALNEQNCADKQSGNDCVDRKYKGKKAKSLHVHKIDLTLITCV